MQSEDDYNVSIVNLPRGIHGFARKNEDDSYSVVLNARDTHERRAAAYLHEVRHILNDDFEAGDVQEIEARAHGAIA